MARALDLSRESNDARIEIEVSPADSQRLGDPDAGADQELGHRAVVLGTSFEVALDLPDSEGVDLGPFDGPFGEVATRVLRQVSPPDGPAERR